MDDSHVSDNHAPPCDIRVEFEEEQAAMEEFLAKVASASTPVTVTVALPFSGNEGQVHVKALTVQPLSAPTPPPPKNRPPPKLRRDGTPRKTRNQVFDKPRVCANCKITFFNIPQFSGHLSKCTPEHPWDGCPSRERSRMLPGAVSAGPFLRKKGHDKDAAINEGDMKKARKAKRKIKRERTADMSEGQRESEMYGMDAPVRKRYRKDVSSITAHAPVDDNVDPELTRMLRELDANPEWQRTLMADHESGVVEEAREREGPSLANIKNEPVSSDHHIEQLHSQPLNAYIQELTDRVQTCTTLMDLLRFDEDLNQRMLAISRIKSNVLVAIQSHVAILPIQPLPSRCKPEGVTSMQQHVEQTVSMDNDIYGGYGSFDLMGMNQVDSIGFSSPSRRY